MEKTMPDREQLLLDCVFALSRLVTACEMQAKGTPCAEIVVQRATAEGRVLLAKVMPEDEPPCSACGSNERGQGGYLSCECPVVPPALGVFDPARPWRAHQHSPGHWSVARDPLPGGGVIEYMRGTGNLSAHEAKSRATAANGVNRLHGSASEGGNSE
jgi:hypothetical protein